MWDLCQKRVSWIKTQSKFKFKDLLRGQKSTHILESRPSSTLGDARGREKKHTQAFRSSATTYNAGTNRNPYIIFNNIVVFTQNV